MRRRHRLRLEERRRANAERCQVPLSEWTAMSRRERRARKRAARATETKEERCG